VRGEDPSSEKSKKKIFGIGNWDIDIIEKFERKNTPVLSV
jgi:hypothetical protein